MYDDFEINGREGHCEPPWFMILIRIRPLPISIPFERFHQMALQAKDSNWTGLKVLLCLRIEGDGHFLGNLNGRDFGCQKCCCQHMGSCFYYWYCVNAIKSWSQRAWAVHSKSQITRNDSQVILGVDRLDYTKGLVNRFHPRQCFWKMIKGREMLDRMTNRFRAFERLLSDFPEFLERVMLLQVIDLLEFVEDLY